MTWSRRPLVAAVSIAAAVGILAVSQAAGQSSQPFDMTPERGNLPVQPAPVQRPAPPASPQPFGATPAPVQPMAPVNPLPPARAVTPMPPVVTTPAPTMPAQQQQAPVAIPAARLPSAPAAAATTQGGTAIIGPNQRFIVPQAALRFQGEIDQRAWTIALAAGQAGRAARLDVSYKNAIVVMPEASRLRVLLNDQVILETPLASSEDFKTVSALVPAGLTQAGANLLRFQVSQRHRTDCSIQSTFELWTDIDPAGTTLTFDNDDTGPALRQLEDIGSVGFDANGVTTIHLIVPTRNQASVAADLLKLTQTIALVGAFPNPKVIISDGPTGTDGAGTLTVLVGTPSEIQSISSAVSNNDGLSVDFIDDASIGRSVMAVSGPNWGQIAGAIDTLSHRVDRPHGVYRQVLNTSPWFAPDVRFFSRGDTVSLSDLGVATQEFSGRRFRTTFGIGIPSDFYAAAYGEATMLLDAAYTSEVLPASHIDIYVNDQIAATTPIVTHGGIFRHLPIEVPLRHFHPGVNRVTIEAMLDTEADQACVPGGSVAGPARFVLFDTTEFSMPNFARIGQLPNLAALSGTAYPYVASTDPIPIVLGGVGGEMLSAAATFMSRLAIQAGRILQVKPTVPAAVGDQSAIFVGAVAQMPAGLFTQMGIDESVRTSWREDVPKQESSAIPASLGGGLLATPPAAASAGAADIGGGDDTEVTFNRWKDELAGGGGWRGQISAFEDWMRRTFDISFSALRIGPATVQIYEPRPKTTVLLAQSASPGGSGTWTMLTAPTDRQLLAGAQGVSAIETWSTVGGQISAFSATTGKVEVQLAAQPEFVVTQPLSIQNLRLIAANWLSNNIIFYAIALMALCLILGVMTSLLLRRLGRPS